MAKAIILLAINRKHSSTGFFFAEVIVLSLKVAKKREKGIFIVKEINVWTVFRRHQYTLILQVVLTYVQSFQFTR